MTDSKDTLPSWDLSDIYKGITDPKIKKDQEFSVAESEKFQKRYYGKVNMVTSPEDLLKMFQEYEVVYLPIAKASQYAHIVFSTDSETAENGVLMQQTNDNYLKTRKNLIFFELGLMELDASKIEELAASPVLKNYKHFIQNILIWKPHKLSEEAEQIFNDKSATANAFLRLFDQNFSLKRFKAAIDGAEKEYTLEEIITLTQNPNRATRKAAAEAITQGLELDLRMNSLIYNTLIKEKAIGDAYRKFSTPEESRHLANELDKETVDSMVAAVTANYKIVEDFYNFKREIMGLDKLYAYDKYAPVTNSVTKYQFSDAKQLVLGAFNNFSPKFGEIAKKFFDNNWIDAQTRIGKRGGAYCTYLTPDLHPLVFLNYTYLNQDVKTLAHELGHAINGVFMQKQTLLNYETPLTLAETASVFAESLLFDEFKKTVTDPKELFDIYMDRIQGIFATVFRQTSMHQFEQEVHYLQKDVGELTPDKINELWVKYQKQMYGNSIEIQDKDANWWSYVPHFLHTPFYVYSYSFGELLVLALYSKYKKDGQGFVDKYIKLMEAGASSSPKKLLAMFEIDLTDKNFWNEGLKYIADLVAEAKALHKKLNS